VCTWDLTTEKFGFMLFFWNAAGIPYGYASNHSCTTLLCMMLITRHVRRCLSRGQGVFGRPPC
jgi:hypothetical protein